MKAKYILYTLGIAMLSSSCNDFLDEDPKGKLTPGTFFSTQDEWQLMRYTKMSV